MIQTVESFEISGIDRDEVLRYLGYRGQDLSRELEARIDAGIARALEVARPRGAFRTFDVDRAATAEGGDAERRVVLEGSTLALDGADITGHLDGAVAVGVLAVTLGAGVDRELSYLSATDALGQVVFDAAATALVERAADAAEARLRAEASARGLFTNARYSCGYGDFPLDAQPSFLATLNAGRLIGLTTTASNLLVPTKSVTAVLGLFETPQPGAITLCPKCHCHDFCTIRLAGRTCRG